ncbi:Fe-S cluster assembly scaffold SufA [Sodalis ligni]|jgi:Fe-S cluster assembly protein SufA|uniref:FeS assembly scaffold SufA n=1 Tax=Sodalis ligni TaxID=2697027 RepID=A0A4R1N6B9_9GAMM|nr:Fe-S cluster assembly scaffold SufA [Sodalis ligni]QWA13628.1 Fe-S cluster assembly scaffold SufA [Sodalis ligni]TCL02673.1 FeS assembly scaffold SufA [Sodalis ligni]
MQTDTVETFSLEDNTWQGLTLSEAAAKQIRRLAEQNAEMRGLRLGVKQSGCAGFGYVVEMATRQEDSELVYERDGAHLYVPLKAMPFIDGTEVDYVQEGLNHVFKFNNPKAQHACGCGESFGL